MYKGIDVSYAQGKIDWAKVKAAGVEFTIIRASFGKNADQVDARFADNFKGCEAVGMPYGFYHYGYADTPARAKLEAAFFLDTVKGTNPTYPLVYDVEDASLAGLSKAALTDTVLAFLEAIKTAGYYPMLYANASWLSNKLDMARLGGYDVWLAQWAAQPTYKGDFGIWQYSDKGSVNGIGCAVDLNTAYKDYPAIIRGARTTDNIPDGYAKDAVEWASANGILLGDASGDFKLHSPVTRQDALVFLHRAMTKI